MVIQNGPRQPFCEKKSKLLIALKWREIGLPKWPPAAILKKKSKKKSCVLIWNGEKCIQKWFKVIQNGRQQPFCEKKIAYWSEMARNAIKGDFRTSKMATGSHLKKKKKLRIDLKWREMRSKVIFRSSKMATGSHFVKKKVAYWSEMARDAIESDFRSSKMAAGSHFVEKIKKIKVVYWSEMARNAYWSENGVKCDRKLFSVIQTSRWQPLCEQNKKLSIDLKWREMRFGHPKWPLTAILWKKIQSCVLLWNGEKCDRNSFSVIQNGGGGEGHHNGQPVNHSGIYTVFALGQIHQF